MKRTGLLLLLMGAALVFFACEKDTMEAPGTDQLDQEEFLMKGAKAKWTFTGTCVPAPVPPIDEGTVTITPEGGTNVIGYIAEWYDQADDYRVTGPSIWYADYYWVGLPFASDCYAEGKTEILVYDPDNDDPEAEPVGLWEMTWQGNLYFEAEGPRLYGSVDGTGKGIEGIVKGMEAKWFYSIDWDFVSPLGYVVEGAFTKAKGKHHKKVPPGK